MVISPDHVGHLHLGIVHDDGKVVCRVAVTSFYDQIIEFLIIECNPPLNQVIYDGHARVRAPEAHHGIGRPGKLLFPARAVILWFSPFRERLLPLIFQLLRSTYAAIGLAFIEEPLYHLPMYIYMLCLEKRSFIPVESQPCQGIENRLC